MFSRRPKNPDGDGSARITGQDHRTCSRPRHSSSWSHNALPGRTSTPGLAGLYRPPQSRPPSTGEGSEFGTAGFSSAVA